MPDIKKCPHCAAPLEQTSETLNLSHGKAHFKSWLCRSCGVRQETRQIGNEPEEILLTSRPRAEVDAEENSRMLAETEGHRQFQTVGGRRHLERQHT